MSEGLHKFLNYELYNLYEVDLMYWMETFSPVYTDTSL